MLLFRAASACLLLALLPLSPGYATAACAGDCDGDRQVSLAELSAMSEAVLHAAPPTCAAVDLNADGGFDVADVVAAVAGRDFICRADDTFTPTIAATTTPSATISNTVTSSPTPGPTVLWRFVEVAAVVGITHTHQQSSPNSTENVGGGVAAGDFDNDGWTDLYVIGGSAGTNRLYRNLGNGRFDEVGAIAGVAIHDQAGSGPLFADLDGDGRLDLFVGGVDGARPHLFLNCTAPGSTPCFRDATAASGLDSGINTIGAAAGDYDRDGDLDVALTHWGALVDAADPPQHLWRNRGDATFVGVDSAAHLTELTGRHPEVPEVEFDYTFTANFTDINADGWPDLLWASDYGSSRVYLNRGDGTFRNTTDAAISDENGMGAAIGDYDGDGDLDWFVSSVWDADGHAEGPWGVTGNRLYRNIGAGRFEDATQSANVREGDWGWASCFADFDNDGNLDLFHVNGFGNVDDEISAPYHDDPARLFISDGNGHFVEQAAIRGIADRGQGRGVVCFDYDHDGDLDVFIANNHGAARLFRNEGGATNHSVTVALRGSAANRFAIGARVELSAGGRVQAAEVRAGSNFVSQNDLNLVFGLAAAPQADGVSVRWPDGSLNTLGAIVAGTRVEVSQNP